MFLTDHCIVGFEPFCSKPGKISRKFVDFQHIFSCSFYVQILYDPDNIQRISESVNIS